MKRPSFWQSILSILSNERGEIGEPTPPTEPTQPAGSVKEGTDKSVPYARFKEVNDHLAEFKQLGLEPSEVVQELQNYRDLITSIKDEAARGDSATDKSKSKLSATKQAEIRQELEELFPGLSKLGEIEQKANASSQAANEASKAHISGLQSQASKMVAQLVDKTGYDVAASEQIEALVANAVYGDKRSLNKFLKGDLSVVESAFNDLEERFLAKNLIKPVRSRAGKNIPTMLSGNVGLSVDSKDLSEKLTEEKLKAMPPQARRAAIGKDAYEFYVALAEARKAASEE